MLYIPTKLKTSEIKNENYLFNVKNEIENS